MDQKNRFEGVTFPTVEVIEAEIKRENHRRRYYKVLKSTVYALVIVAALAVLVATLVLPVVQITGTSMEPNLHEGDIIVLVKTNRIERGDLCAFSYSNKILIKRVIGLPGDFVEVDSQGNVFVNNELIDEPYISEKALGDCDIEFPYQVPENQYFLMGDQRATSVDSRNSVIGCVTRDQMVGIILFRVWPLNGGLKVD